MAPAPLPAAVRAALIALLVGSLGAGACSSGSGQGGPATSTSLAADTTDRGSGGSPSPSVGTGPFCTNVRALVDLDDAGDPTPEAVLAQVEAMVVLLDEITVNVPEDSPPDVEVLLEDLRAIASAVARAGGDTDAAYAALEAEQPDLWARLVDPGSHDEAFTFFADRCGTPMP